MCGTCACGSAEQPPSAAPAEPSPRRLQLEQHLLAHNDSLAAANRRLFRQAGVRVVNLLSSPGSGKTALLERLAGEQGRLGRMAALVGDLATRLDAERLQAAGLPAVAVNTGQACHLDAAMVARGLEALAAIGIPLADLDWLWIENVGNLVCPAGYDLGEDLRLVLLSVTEGADKPLKYPALFRSADQVLITKKDLADAVGFDSAAARRVISRAAPQATVLEASVHSGEGIEILLTQLCRPEQDTQQAMALSKAGM